MKHPVFAANWKMNQAPADAKAFVRQFLAYFPRQQDRLVLIFPSALTLHAVTDALKDRPDIQVGVQNIYWEDILDISDSSDSTLLNTNIVKY